MTLQGDITAHAPKCSRQLPWCLLCGIKGIGASTGGQRDERQDFMLVQSGFALYIVRAKETL